MTELAATPHRAFSPSRILAITSNTVLELVRLKVFYFMLVFALLLIGSSAFTSRLGFQEQFQSLKAVSLGAMSIFSWLLAVLATAALLPKDIEDRTLYTILAKPVPRIEYLLGKLLGVFVLLAVAIVLMSAVFAFVLSVTEQMAIAQAQRDNPPDQVAAAVDAIRASTFSKSVAECVIMIFVKACLCSAFTLLLSTFATSSIFTIMVSIAVYLISYVQPIAREYMLSSMSSGAITRFFLAFVALLFPDITAIDLVDDTVAGNMISLGLFLKSAGLGAVYTAVYFFGGYFMFSTKEL